MHDGVPDVRSLVRWSMLLLVLTICRVEAAWNNPYSEDEWYKDILYSSFAERPKHLDPVRSYSENEAVFIGQIYEPPLQYHYLKRPYTLIPLVAAELPVVKYFDADNNLLPQSTEPSDIAFSEYEFHIKPGILYQPHPALAKSSSGDYLYHTLTAEMLDDIHTLSDFPVSGTRELTAEDFVYQVKRLANPRLYSPIAGVMADYIVGFDKLREDLAQAYAASSTPDETHFLDLREFALEGAHVVDRYTYTIRLKGKYPQFVYWQAMYFFAPMPWEAERFYLQSGMQQRNITLDWYPIGTGPFMLTENNPNLRMVLEHNPNFRGELYPLDGELDDLEGGLLVDAGRAMPFINKAVYTLEKESIPRWNKFLQGYYDTAAIGSDSFDQAIQFSPQGEATLTQGMKDKGIALSTSIAPTIVYMGFNMLDPVLGGDTERARKLRRAISIAVDFEEYISVFLNGRGVSAQGPIPEGIYGFRQGQDGINPHIYEWVDDLPRRKSLDYARNLMSESGYANGVDSLTGRPLVINFEAVARGPDDNARFNWIRKQFEKLGIQAVIRTTDYNRFQEKMRTGKAGVYMWGWNADYPDPENFLFLLYGPNAKVDSGGENASNYKNAQFDQLFDRMKNMDNGPERQKVIDEMVDIIRHDAPWAGGFHPKDFSLHHGWYQNIKVNKMARNALKYKKLDATSRVARRDQWNRPVVLPLGLVVGVFALGLVPAVVSYRRRQRATAL
ncbi:MAG: ABC transporter substrate-binding protein [Gammaproteobacteria bacterium]|nr:ABC transporter substrate-binding protein [Gammaproteobacteria bacterium]